MPLLFWYLPFMIVAGAFDALYEQDGTRSLERERRGLRLRRLAFSRRGLDVAVLGKTASPGRLDSGQDRGFDTRQGRTEREYKGGPPLKLDYGRVGLMIA
jgi:hypothetical protein